MIVTIDRMVFRPGASTFFLVAPPLAVRAAGCPAHRHLSQFNTVTSLLIASFPIPPSPNGEWAVPFLISLKAYNAKCAAAASFACAKPGLVILLFWGFLFL